MSSAVQWITFVHFRFNLFGIFPELLLFPSQLHQCNTLTGCAHQKHISFLFHVTLSHCMTNVSKSDIFIM